MTFLHVLIKNDNIIVLELIFMLAASVFKPKQYDLKISSVKFTEMSGYARLTFEPCSMF